MSGDERLLSSPLFLWSYQNPQAGIEAIASIPDPPKIDEQARRLKERKMIMSNEAVSDYFPSDYFPKETIRFDVPAVGEPKPALKYRLFPPRFARKVGNAAPVYRKAFDMVKDLEENDGDRFNSIRLLVIRGEESRKKWWGDNIPQELSPEEVARFFVDYAELFALLDEASLYAECDWELSIEDQSWWGSDDFQDFLPAAYLITPLLVVQAYYALEQEDTELAFRSIQNLYALAENLLQAPMTLSVIVASGVIDSAASCVAHVIASGKYPNLYWPLTQIPRFSHRYLRVVESDRNEFFRDYPQVKEINNLARDEDHDYWQEFGKKFLVDIQGHVDLDFHVKSFEEVKEEMGIEDEESLPFEEAKEKVKQEMLEHGAEIYKDNPEGFEAYKKSLEPADPQAILDELPTIKQAVLDWGYPLERVERLCAEHLVAIYAVYVYEELWDEVMKWHGVDFVTSQRFLEGAGGESIQQMIQSYNTMLAEKIANTLDRIGWPMIVGADEETDALRIVEAIRLYAASHDGKLPKKLDNITEVPIPLSPRTGEPFRYKIEKTKEGKIGVLEFTTNVFKEHRYEIRIVGS